jgi:hypothetical protein
MVSQKVKWLTDYILGELPFIVLFYFWIFESSTLAQSLLHIIFWWFFILAIIIKFVKVKFKKLNNKEALVFIMPYSIIFDYLILIMLIILKDFLYAILWLWTCWILIDITYKRINMR